MNMGLRNDKYGTQSTTAEEIDFCIERVVEQVRRLRELTPDMSSVGVDCVPLARFPGIIAG